MRRFVLMILCLVVSSGLAIAPAQAVQQHSTSVSQQATTSTTWTKVRGVSCKYARGKLKVVTHHRRSIGYRSKNGAVHIVLNNKPAGTYYITLPAVKYGKTAYFAGVTTYYSPDVQGFWVSRYFKFQRPSYAACH